MGDSRKLGFDGPQLPMSFGEGLVKKNRDDLNTGLLLQYKGFYAGVSVFHINRPDIGRMGSSRLPARLSLNASYIFSISPEDQVIVTVVYDRQACYRSTNLSLNWLLQKN